MSKTIPILTVVDATKLANTGSANGTVWMFDNQGYTGEQEATNELITNCTDGDILQWTIVAIQTDVDISINRFNGTAINDSIIDPVLMNGINEPYWTSRVELAANSAGKYQYAFDIVINDTSYSFDPFLQIASS